MKSFVFLRASLSLLGEEAHPPGALDPFAGVFSPFSAILVVAVLVFVLWWLLRAQAGQVEPVAHDHHADHGDHGEHAHEDHAEAAPAPAEAPDGPDDLKVLEGVGPKVEAALNAAGITSYAQLSAASVDALQAILDEAGYQYMKPASWPEQARLAGADEWDALKKLQDELDAGRKN